MLCLTLLHGSPPWNDSLHFRAVHETELDGFDTESDNTALIDVFLTVKHNSAARNACASTRPHGGASSAGQLFNQLKFYNGNIKHDRTFTFGELNTPGKCFVIITETVSESDFLLRHMRDSFTVGDLVAIIEPEASEITRLQINSAERIPMGSCVQQEMNSPKQGLSESKGYFFPCRHL